MLAAMDAQALRDHIDTDIDVNAMPVGRTLLMDCAELGLAEHVQILLGAGANPDICEDAGDDGEGYTAFMIAIANGQSVCAEILCAATGNKNAEIAGVTPLALACEWNMPTVVATLISAGVDISRPVGQNNAHVNDDTPVMIAAGLGHIHCLELLIDAGADVHHANFLGENALHHAARSNHFQCVRALIRAGIDVHAETQSGERAIDLAAKAAALPCLSHLLRAGALNIEYPAGPLIKMLEDGDYHPHTIRRFIRAGLDVNAHGADGGTLLSYAINIMHHNAVEDLLQDFAADPNRINKNGSTPLIRACVNSDSFSTLMLIDHGADINAADARGRTPVMLAMSRGAADCTDLLLGAGAKWPDFNFAVKLLTDKRLGAHTADTFMQIMAANGVSTQSALEAINGLDTAGARVVRPLLEVRLLPQVKTGNPKRTPSHI